MATTYETIISSLPKLTQKQLEDVKNRIGFLEETTTTERTQDYSDVADLYEAIKKCNSITKAPPINIIMKSALGKKAKQAYEQVDGFIEDEFGELPRLKRIWVYTLLCSCVEKELPQRNVPINITTFFNALCSPKSIFASQFPHYLGNQAAMSLLTKASFDGR